MLSELLLLVAGAVFAVKKTIIEPEERNWLSSKKTVKSSSPSCVAKLMTRETWFTVILLFIYDWELSQIWKEKYNIITFSC